MGKFQPLTGLKKNAITWEISAQPDTEFESGNLGETRGNYIYCCTQGFYECVYEFSAWAENF